jgi:hypothetical protein
MGNTRSVSRLLVAGIIVLTAGCNRTPEVVTPEAASAKGDAMLKEMSKSLGSLQTFSYTATERREVVKGGGKQEIHATRHVVIRRPNAFTFTTKGDERDGAGWYDGKHITLVSNRLKVWARGPMPATLDEALDYVSAEYAIQMPTADLLYTNPYEAFMTSDTTGGWVDVQPIGDLTCDHLAYRQAAVDWELWLSPGRQLPCQVKIVYKNDPGQPMTMVTYTEFNPAPPVSDDTFKATIPDGYQRIKIMRHATVTDPKVEEAPADAGVKKQVP